MARWWWLGLGIGCGQVAPVPPPPLPCGGNPGPVGTRCVDGTWLEAEPWTVATWSTCANAGACAPIEVAARADGAAYGMDVYEAQEACRAIGGSLPSARAVPSDPLDGVWREAHASWQTGQRAQPGLDLQGQLGVRCMFLDAHEAKHPTWTALLAAKPYTVTDPTALVRWDPGYNKWAERDLQGAGFAELAETWKDARMVAHLLRQLHARHRDVTRLHQIGVSHQGTPILALQIRGGGPPFEGGRRPSVLLDGSHHGHELLSVDLALDAARDLLDRRDEPQVQRWLNGLEVWVVPLVNPDGNHVVLQVDGRDKRGRKNGRDVDGDGVLSDGEGVDLNRNYPFQWGGLGDRGSQADPGSWYYRGSEPASELETRAILGLADRLHFAASISYHTNGNMLLSPYTIDGVRNPAPDAPWTIAAELVADLPPQARGKPLVVRRNMYPVDGTDQDHLRHAFGTVAYILEAPDHNPAELARRQANLDGLRPVYQRLLDRVLDGPRISGHVVGPDGAPVEAVVSVAEIRLNAGEQWTSRAADGRFDRLLAGAGRFTVRAEAEGHGVVEQVVDVHGVVDVELRLPR